MKYHIGIKKLSLLLDKRLAGPEGMALEEHLSACNSCNDKWLSLQACKDMLKRLPEPEVSPDLDIELRRRLGFEDGIQKELLRPSPFLRRAVALVTLTSFFFLFVVWNEITAMPTIAHVDGYAEIYNPIKGQWRAAKAGRRIERGSLIRVPKGRVNIKSRKYEIMLKEGATVRAVSPESLFGRAGAISFRLDEGKMLVATKKGLRGASFIVDSRLAEVEARGTGFMVDVSEEENRTWVGVLEGDVEVRAKYNLAKAPASVTVNSGRATVIVPDSAPSDPRYHLEKEWEEIKEIYSIGEEPQVALLVSMTPRRVHELLRPAGLFISGKKRKTLPRELVKIAGYINDAIIKEDRKKHRDAIRSLESLVQRDPDPKYNVQFLFFIASYYYYINDYEDAISTLDKIIERYPSSGLISLALAARGLIYERGLKDAGNAAISYQALLSKHPDSLEVEEAKNGLARLGF